MTPVYRPNGFNDAVNFIKIMCRINTYNCPEKGSVKEYAQWIGYRTWNAVKHIFGQSDWQIAKRTLSAKLLESNFISKDTADSVSETYLYVIIDRKLRTSILGAFQMASSNRTQAPKLEEMYPMAVDVAKRIGIDLPPVDEMKKQLQAIPLILNTTLKAAGVQMPAELTKVISQVTGQGQGGVPAPASKT